MNVSALTLSTGLLLCLFGGAAGLSRLRFRSKVVPVPLTQKPRSDQRSYQYARLPNGLQVVNVQDKSAVTAAYSMAVQAGSYDDPPQLPGLAHFCEHMLFLGTANYPSATGYDNFVSANGGYVNAYTSVEATVYYTELAQSAVGEGLSRFADFFRAPLFDGRFVKKEVNAIDSEHAKNVQDPNWRLQAVMYSLASPSSPVSAFHTGNAETLYRTPSQKGLDPDAALKVWFKEHYCPGRMDLVTLGPDPLDKQLAKVVQLFGNISAGDPSCEGAPRSWAEPSPWPAERLGKWATVQGTLPQAQLTLLFVIPDLSKEYRSHPTTYVNYVLTYGGEQSLLTVLRDKLGLISDMGVDADFASSGGTLWVQWTLTPQGRQHMESILDVFFHYVAGLRAKPVDLALYASLANLTRLRWDWASPGKPADAASDLAERLTRMPPERLLSSSLIEAPDEALGAAILAKLVPGNMNAALVVPDAEDHFRGADVRTLAHYDVRYTVTAIQAQFPGAVQRWDAWLAAGGTAQASDELVRKVVAGGVSGFSSDAIPVPPAALADVSTDVPTQFMRVQEAVGDQVLMSSPGAYSTALYGPRPEKLDGEEHTWYRMGWVSASPQVQMSLVLRPWRTAGEWESPATNQVRLALYASLLTQELAPKTFDSAVAGASYGLDFSEDGTKLSFSGFPAQLPRLVRSVLTELRAGVNVTNSAQYDRLVQQANETWRSYGGMPSKYAVQDRNLLLTTGVLSREELLAALEEVQLQGVASAAQELVLNRPLELTALVMGNLDEESAREALAAVRQSLPSTATSQDPKGEVLLFTPIVRPAGPVELRKPNPRHDDPNDVVVVSVLGGLRTVESRVLVGLLGSMLSQVAFNELRTNQQLGYVVNAGEISLGNVEGVSTVVQGKALKADAMEAAVEQVYLKIMPKFLEDLTADDFDSYRSSFKQQLLQPPTSAGEEFDHFWDAASSHGICLGVRNEMLAYLDASVATKDALVRTWQDLMFPPATASEAGLRQKVVVKYFAGGVPSRLNATEVADLWQQRELSGAGLELLQKEFGQTILLGAADSSARKQLAKDGGYYPLDLHCKRAEVDSAASTLEAQKHGPPGLLAAGAESHLPERRPHPPPGAAAAARSSGPLPDTQ